MRVRARKIHASLTPNRPNHLNGPRLYGRLVLLTPLLFSETLTREGLFGTAPFTWFHVVAVLFDLFDNVLRLHLSLEASECILQRFSLLNDNFCHAYSPPFPVEC
jgi:hypothetical protein